MAETRLAYFSETRNRKRKAVNHHSFVRYFQKRPNPGNGSHSRWPNNLSFSSICFCSWRSLTASPWCQSNKTFSSVPTLKTFYGLNKLCSVITSVFVIVAHILLALSNTLVFFVTEFVTVLRTCIINCT